MSATPIRAPAHVAGGLGDMSVIETPPKDRIAIQTSVALSRGSHPAAIEAELAAKGSVFRAQRVNPSFVAAL